MNITKRLIENVGRRGDAMEKQKSVIEEMLKAGNTRALHIRPMSWGPITIMAKDDMAHRLFVFTPEEFDALIQKENK